MAVRAQFENNNDIGVFAKLTSAYCLVPIGGSENFYRCAREELEGEMGHCLYPTGKRSCKLTFKLNTCSVILCFLTLLLYFGHLFLHFPPRPFHLPLKPRCMIFL